MRPAPARAPGGQCYVRLTRNIAVVILAAGQSRRMGQRNKLMLPVAGKPLIAFSLRPFEGFIWHQKVAVVGDDSAVARQTARYGFRTVCNPDAPAGRMRSLRVALDALRPGFSAVMVALADQPLLRPDDILKLVKAFARSAPHAIVVPLHRRRPGNPRILAGSHIDRLCAAGPALDARRYIDTRAEQVHWVSMHHDHVVRDVDDPAGYRRLKRRLMIERRHAGGG